MFDVCKLTNSLPVCCVVQEQCCDYMFAQAIKTDNRTFIENKAKFLQVKVFLSHVHVYLSVCLAVCVSVCLFVYLYCVCLFV